MTDLKVEQAVENICELGCREVNKVIAELSLNNSSNFTNTFNSNQRQTVLSELSEIMSVYDSPCDIRN